MLWGLVTLYFLGLLASVFFFYDIINDFQGFPIEKNL